MTYGFELSFDELDEDLQQDKIDEYIEYCEREEGDDYKKISQEEKEEDARRSIEVHFPIYF